jgi:DNA modification methylase
MLRVNAVCQGDALETLRTFPNHCVDLVMTSPPYADSRKHSYGGVAVRGYVAWLRPISEQLYRVLKPTGSFILNIKEGVVNGERSTHVIELLLAMGEQGWLWTEEYIWHKKNCYPGKWPNRFRDAWEHCYHFTKQRQFYMDQRAVMVPAATATRRRSAGISTNDLVLQQSKTGSGFSRRMQTCLGRNLVYPTNVLHLATECHNRQHSAAFPVALPAWFIKLLTRESDLVLDPFLGSGTTAVAAVELGRNFVGIELQPKFADIARRRIGQYVKTVRRAA